MNAAPTTADPTTSGNQLTGKHLTFVLGQECYAIPALQVREIIRLTHITAVPQMPDYIRGVINLRGRIVPVMDLRLRIGLPAAAHADETCIIVVQVHTSHHRSTPMGMIVDGVEEVAQFASDDIEETPDFGLQMTADYLLGMAKIKGRVKVLIDIDRVVGADPAMQRAATSPF